jgi:gliding motility associated protien GldN
MKTTIIICGCTLIGAIAAQAQSAEGRIYNKSERVYDINDREGISQTVWHEDNGGRASVSYPYLREADVMWSRTVWRKLDMREKMNHPIYYPLEATKERISLVQLMLNAMNEGSLTAYDAMNDEFTTPLSRSSTRNFGSWTDTVYVPNPDPPYDVEMKLVEHEFDPSTVKEFRIKEVWFFDKQRSELNVRIVGICPVAENIDPVTGEVRGLSPMFWVYFPELRNILSTTRVFTRFNGNMEMTYDDLFWKRMFSSYIYKVQNVYDRKIADYATGINAMLESEKVQNDIFNYEMDLWEY